MKAHFTVYLIALGSFGLVFPASIIAQPQGLTDPAPQKADPGDPPHQPEKKDVPEPPDQPVEDPPVPPDQPVKDPPVPPEQPVKDPPVPPEQPVEDPPVPPDQPVEDLPKPPAQPEEEEKDLPGPPDFPKNEEETPKAPEQPAGLPPEEQTEKPDLPDPVPPVEEPGLPTKPEVPLLLPDGGQPKPPGNDSEENGDAEKRPPDRLPERLPEFVDELKAARSFYNEERKALRDILKRAVEALGDKATKEEIEAVVSTFRAQHAALITVQKATAEEIKQGAKELAQSGAPSSVTEMREILSKARSDRKKARAAFEIALEDAGPGDEKRAIKEAFRAEQRDLHRRLKDEVKKLRELARKQAQEGDRRDD